jgi:hypothetical protein
MKRYRSLLIVLCITTALLMGLILFQRSRQGSSQGVENVLNRFELPQELGAVGVGEKELTEIRQMGLAGVADLSTLLNSPDRKLRLKSAWALGRVGPLATNSIPALSAAISNQDPGVRYLAIQALTSLHVYNEKLVPSLLDSLGDKNPMVCVAAGNLLNTIETNRLSTGLPGISGSQTEYALAFLRSPCVRIQLMGLERLGTVRQSDARLAEAVKTLESSPTPPVRAKAAAMLAHLHSLPE